MTDVDGKKLRCGDRVQIAPQSESAESPIGTVVSTNTVYAFVEIADKQIVKCESASLISLSD